MKLKTLKDLEKGAHVGDIKKIVDEERKVGSDWTTSIVLAGDLKQEAIQWIKELEKKHKKVHTVPVNACYYCNVIDWIKHFFNITKED